MSGITVGVRVRPFNERERRYESKNIVSMCDANPGLVQVSVVRKGVVSDKEKPREFHFDHGIWSHSRDAEECAFRDQSAVYALLGAPVVQNVVDGFHSALFAYGQTGSGKTYSMLGFPSEEGLIHRVSDELFTSARNLVDQPDNSFTAYSIECSYLEIYNEQVMDLLDTKQQAFGSTALKVRQHPSRGIFVEGLSSVAVKNFDSVLQLLAQGDLQRKVAATNMNATSSRSHAVLTLRLTAIDEGCQCQRVSKLSMIDLAGSERASSTGAEGDTLVEGSNINRSLTVLGMCLDRLAEQSDAASKSAGLPVPFRDSQLTFLLSESLGGNSKTTLLANISPADVNCDETLSTLRFAQVAKRVKTKAVVNETAAAKLIRELRAELAALHHQLKDAQQRRAAKVPAAPVASLAAADPDASQDGAVVETTGTAAVAELHETHAATDEATCGSACDTASPLGLSDQTSDLQLQIEETMAAILERELVRDDDACLAGLAPQATVAEEAAPLSSVFVDWNAPQLICLSHFLDPIAQEVRGGVSFFALEQGRWSLVSTQSCRTQHTISLAYSPIDCQLSIVLEDTEQSTTTLEVDGQCISRGATAVLRHGSRISISVASTDSQTKFSCAFRVSHCASLANAPKFSHRVSALRQNNGLCGFDHLACLETFYRATIELEWLRYGDVDGNSTYSTALDMKCIRECLGQLEKEVLAQLCVTEATLASLFAASPAEIAAYLRSAASSSASAQTAIIIIGEKNAVVDSDDEADGEQSLKNLMLEVDALKEEARAAEAHMKEEEARISASIAFATRERRAREMSIFVHESKRKDQVLRRSRDAAELFSALHDDIEPQCIPNEARATSIPVEASGREQQNGGTSLDERNRRQEISAANEKRLFDECASNQRLAEGPVHSRSAADTSEPPASLSNPQVQAHAQPPTKPSSADSREIVDRTNNNTVNHNNTADNTNHRNQQQQQHREPEQTEQQATTPTTRTNTDGSTNHRNPPQQPTTPTNNNTEQQQHRQPEQAPTTTPTTAASNNNNSDHPIKQQPAVTTIQKLKDDHHEIYSKLRERHTSEVLSALKELESESLRQAAVTDECLNAEFGQVRERLHDKHAEQLAKAPAAQHEALISTHREDIQRLHVLEVHVREKARDVVTRLMKTKTERTLASMKQTSANSLRLAVAIHDEEESNQPSLQAENIRTLEDFSKQKEVLVERCRRRHRRLKLKLKKEQELLNAHVQRLEKVDQEHLTALSMERKAVLVEHARCALGPNAPPEELSEVLESIDTAIQRVFATESATLQARRMVISQEKLTRVAEQMSNEDAANAHLATVEVRQLVDVASRAASSSNNEAVDQALAAALHLQAADPLECTTAEIFSEINSARTEEYRTSSNEEVPDLELEGALASVANDDVVSDELYGDLFEVDAAQHPVECLAARGCQSQPAAEQKRPTDNTASSSTRAASGESFAERLASTGDANPLEAVIVCQPQSSSTESPLSAEVDRTNHHVLTDSARCATGSDKEAAVQGEEQCMSDFPTSAAGGAARVQKEQIAEAYTGRGSSSKKLQDAHAEVSDVTHRTLVGWDVGALVNGELSSPDMPEVLHSHAQEIATNEAVLEASGIHEGAQQEEHLHDDDDSSDENSIDESPEAIDSELLWHRTVRESRQPRPDGLTVRGRLDEAEDVGVWQRFANDSKDKLPFLREIHTKQLDFYWARIEAEERENARRHSLMERAEEEMCKSIALSPTFANVFATTSSTSPSGLQQQAALSGGGTFCVAGRRLLPLVEQRAGYLWKLNQGVRSRTWEYRFAIICGRFLYYFYNADGTGRSLAALYLYGANVTLCTEPLETKPFVIRLTTVAARRLKDKATTFHFAFASNLERAWWAHWLSQAALPSPPRAFLNKVVSEVTRDPTWSIETAASHAQAGSMTFYLVPPSLWAGAAPSAPISAEAGPIAGLVQAKHIHWEPDQLATLCAACKCTFGVFRRRHHCRACGGVFCDSCTSIVDMYNQKDELKKKRTCRACIAASVTRVGRGSLHEPDGKPEKSASELSQVSSDQRLHASVASSRDAPTPQQDLHAV